MTACPLKPGMRVQHWHSYIATVAKVSGDAAWLRDFDASLGRKDDDLNRPGQGLRVARGLPKRDLILRLQKETRKLGRMERKAAP